jgi:hypothetical protein
MYHLLNTLFEITHQTAAIRNEINKSIKLGSLRRHEFSFLEMKIKFVYGWAEIRRSLMKNSFGILIKLRSLLGIFGDDIILQNVGFVDYFIAWWQAEAKSLSCNRIWIAIKPYLKLILDTFSGVFHADLILLKPTKFRVVCS